MKKPSFRFQTPDVGDSNEVTPNRSSSHRAGPDGFAPGIYDGVPASDRRIVRTMMQIFRIVDGQIEEEWNEGGSLLD